MAKERKVEVHELIADGFARFHVDNVQLEIDDPEVYNGIRKVLK